MTGRNALPSSIKAGTSSCCWKKKKDKIRCAFPGQMSECGVTIFCRRNSPAFAVFRSIITGTLWHAPLLPSQLFCATRSQTVFWALRDSYTCVRQWFCRRLGSVECGYAQKTRGYIERHLRRCSRRGPQPHNRRDVHILRRWRCAFNAFACIWTNKERPRIVMHKINQEESIIYVAHSCSVLFFK